MPDLSLYQRGQRVGHGRYTLLRPLGQGGMGWVWLAEDTRLGQATALKFLPPEVQADAVAQDDLRRETQRCLRLSHPHIVRIYDLFQSEDEPPFITMEFMEGQNLNVLRLEQPSRTLAWNFLQPLVQQLCAALEYAHGEKVIHRDLKPANLMLDGRGRLKLADFGVAAVVNDSVSRVSQRQATSGTLAYMSPQQLDGHTPKVSDDIYALGATLYELLSSRPPFYRGDVTHQIRSLPPPPLDERLEELELENDVPPDVAALVMACLAKDAALRPQSARAVAEWIGLDATHPASPSTWSASLDPEPRPEAEAALPAEPPDVEAEEASLSPPLDVAAEVVAVSDEASTPTSDAASGRGGVWVTMGLILLLLAGIVALIVWEMRRSGKLPGVFRPAPGTPIVSTAPPEFVWAQRLGKSYASHNDEYRPGVALDGNGGVYLTGHFVNGSTFGGTPLDNHGGRDIFVARYRPDGALDWIESAGGPSEDGGRGIAVDAQRNCYVTGWFTERATFGSTVLTAAGDWDVFLAKYDASGQLQWAQKAGGRGKDSGVGIAVDAAGRGFVAGHFYADARFGETELTSAGDRDIFLTRFDTAGRFLWTQRAGGAGDDLGMSVALDRAGGCFLAGHFSRTAHFGDEAVTSAGGTDGFVARYRQDGRLMWVRGLGGQGSDEIGGIATDAEGNGYVTGYFSEALGNGVGTLLQSAGDWDVFTAKFDARGNLQWIQGGGGAGRDGGQGIGLDAEGNCYVSGGFNGTAQFGATVLVSQGLWDVFVAKYDRRGGLVWALSAGGAGSDWSESLAVGRDGSCHLAGWFQRAASFGPHRLSTDGVESLFVAKLAKAQR